MNVYEAINARRSVRAYKKDKPVPSDVLNRMLEAVRMAPSGGNRQPWKFVVVTDHETRRKLAEAANGQNFVAEAPVVIAAVGLSPERMMSCEIPGDSVDLAIAIDHLTLAAVEEGLGTCWIGAFSQEKVCRILHVPASCKVIELLTLGYPADLPRAKARKSRNEIICHEKFS
jgi:nitroreductase